MEASCVGRASAEGRKPSCCWSNHHRRLPHDEASFSPGAQQQLTRQQLYQQQLYQQHLYQHQLYRHQQQHLVGSQRSGGACAGLASHSGIQIKQCAVSEEARYFDEHSNAHQAVENVDGLIAELMIEDLPEERKEDH